MTELNQTDLRTLTTGNKRAWDAFVAAAAPLINAVVRRTLQAFGLGEEDGIFGGHEGAQTPATSEQGTAAKTPQA